MRIFDYCPACKHNNDIGGGITECEMGRHTEHREAQTNRGLCECEYWEAR